MDSFYLNISLLKVDVEANQDEADVEEQGQQATNDQENLFANVLILKSIPSLKWEDKKVDSGDDGMIDNADNGDNSDICDNGDNGMCQTAKWTGS